MIDDVIAGVVAFIVMEPVTYAVHRWLMHGLGWVLHRSHHRIRRPSGSLSARVEANDLFPVAFAALTVAAMAVATARPSAHLLLPVGVGVTAYGAAYAAVHDLYIHGRFVRLPAVRPLEILRHAHALHHRFGGEPYGMLCPIVPRELRERARAGQRPAETMARATTPSFWPMGTLTRAEKTS